MSTKEEKLTAIDRLENDIGSHRIIKTEEANKIGEPFGLTFGGTSFKHDPNNPKGPLWDFEDGVSSFTLASRIADVTAGMERESYMGRGFQFRSDCKAARLAIMNEGIKPSENDTDGPGKFSTVS